MAARFSANVGKRLGDANVAMRQVIKNYRKLCRHIEVHMPEVLLNALEPTFEKSQTYVPVDTGALRDSGYLEIREFRNKPRVEIGYGRGGHPAHATAVHENLEWRHAYPTRAKFLQAALEEDADLVQKRIVAELEGIFGPGKAGRIRRRS